MPYRIKSKPQALFAWALFVAIVGFYTVAALRFPMVYIWATYEDLVGEWVQVWSVVVALAISVRLTVARWRFRWFFALLSLSCFYVAMEEISWGQRIVGFSSPTFFKAKNLQSETNLHNLLTGPYATTLKTSLSYGLAVALAVYGFVYPASLWLRFRVARWMDARGLAAPPLYLWPFFVTAAVLECGPFKFNEAEVAEILVGMGLTLMTVHYACVRPRWVASRASPRVSPDELSGPVDIAPGTLARRLAMATALVLLLSLGTTSAIYASPPRRARIHNRIENGVEKFAGRYARFEQWETAIQLYERVHEKEPERLSIRRKLAECASDMGDRKRAERYLLEALEFDLQRLEGRPGSASTRRSLVRTYRMLGDRESAQVHLQDALQITRRRVEEKPDSAPAAYALGKTYTLMGEYGLALEQLSRAYDLRPTSKKYRKAYYRARRSAP